MTSSLSTIAVDCHDPFLLASFWTAALGYVDDPENPNSPGDPETLLIDPRGLHPDLLFIPVPEDKVVKNRLHLDLMPDIRRDAEVERILALGATLVDDLRTPDGGGWAVLADPEGNEFCVLRSKAERPEPLPVDAGERRFPPVLITDERAVVESMLEWYRAGIVTKVEGLAQHKAVARPLRSATSIAGLVKHLALVEESWFVERFAGGQPSEWWADVDWDADPDWEFNTVDSEPIELQIERYQAACARCREAVAGHGLDDLAVGAAEGREFNLRFAFTHLLEETARHLGHLDVLRELLDGTTGE